MIEENPTEQAEYEKRLRRRLNILIEKLKEGKVRFPGGLDMEKSLLKMRYGAGGEIDLNTVDGSVRSMALAITAIHDREELKKEASLAEIQNMYFKFIEDNFRVFYDLMIKRGMTPHDAGMAAKNSQASIKEVTQNLKGFLEIIDQFWEGVGDIAHIHVEDMRGNVKGVFGGDLFPSHNENIASKCGIYTDTIILPDPFLRTKHIFDHYSDADKAYYLMKHGLNLLQYKDLACAEVDTPIVVILPDLSVLEEDEREFYHKLGKEDSLIHAKKLFDRNFESIEELMDFCNSLDSACQKTPE